MPLFEGAWNFVRRHRRKILVVGVVVGGAALLKRYAERKFRDWAESERLECLERLKREQHFDSTRLTCRTTVASLIPNFKDRVLVLCDCDSLTKRIKERPSNRLQLWEELKRMSFVRLVVQVYGSALLVTLLNVQLNIMGGSMFVDVAPICGGAADINVPVHPPRMPRPVQQRYLAVVHDFLGDGVATLTSLVQNAVDDVIGDVSLKDKLSIAKIQELFTAVQCILEADTVTGVNCSRVLGLLNSPLLHELTGGNNSVSTNDDYILARILDETTELVESDDCKKVLGLTVKAGFSVVADALLESFASARTSAATSTQDEGISSCFVNPNEVSLPMAKVIPVVSDVGRRLLIGDLSEQFLSAMFALEAQQVIGANIYESFSQRSGVDSTTQ